ncbi:hypothetical protein JMJ35_006575 [Cladonia borealis]|uniref:Amidase domain-containing protein n=1 Tax=Cladonia borealis TaxID=184061 RepID=A0AA39QXI5_9LECA|nr:hypothetical protein JMJ35_006575 [Cladonia borealis]
MSHNISLWPDVEEQHPVFNVGKARYTAIPVKTDLPRLKIPETDHLVTVLSAQKADLDNVHWLDHCKRDFRSLGEDVWTVNFLDGLIISSDWLPSLALTAEIKRRTAWHAIVPGLDLPNGPYTLSKNVLSQVYRLYDDEQGAFMVPVKPVRKNDRPFESLGIVGTIPHSLSVAVPSRICSSPSAATPLLGMRIGVKDLFDIAYLRMTLSNRAFYAASTPAPTTAPAIQKLLDAGAVMVGTTKCSSMISREDPTEAVDYQAPYNPRGDGYQSPVGSSSGSAAAIASYDWLDFTIGSDTTGSSRRPAFVNGCFQFRFSHAALSLEGVRPCFSRFDAPALFARDIDGLETFVRAWCGPKEHPQHHKPTVIIYPLDYLPVANEKQQKMLETIVKDVADYCKIDVKNISFRDLWLESPPKEAAGKSLHEFLQDAGRNSFVYDFCDNCDEFRRTYERKHDRVPVTNKVTRWRWEIGSDITPEQRKDAMQRMEVYKEWVLQKVLHVDDQTALVVLPIKDAEPNYRDIDPGPAFAQDVWDPLWLSPVLEAPEISVPVGELLYQSRMSERSECLPVAVSFLGPPGADIMLANTLKASFAKAGRPLAVNVGRNMYGLASTYVA